MSSSESLINSLQTVDGDEYRTSQPKLGISVFNEPYYWNPVDNGTYSAKSNNRVRFDIPQTDIWDFRHGWLAADVTLFSDGNSTDGNAPYLRMVNGSWNAIERFRHLSNLSPIEEMYPYAYLFSWQWVFEQSEIIEQTYHEMFGVGTKNDRESWAMPNTEGGAMGGKPKRLIFPIDLGWLTSGPFPAKILNTLQSIEFYLSDPNQFIESNCGNLNFVLSNLELHAYKLTSKFPNMINETRGMSWEEGFTRYVRSGQYRVMLDHYDWFQNVITNPQAQYTIPVKTAAIQSICTTFMNAQQISNPKINDKALTFPKMDLSQFQMTLFTKTFPSQPCECRDDAFQAYMFYVNYVNSWKINGFPGSDPMTPDAINEAPIKLKEFNTTAWTCVSDFRSIRKAQSVNPIFSTEKLTESSIKLELRFDSAIPAGTVANSIVRSSSIFGCTADGSPMVCLN